MSSCKKKMKLISSKLMILVTNSPKYSKAFTLWKIETIFKYIFLFHHLFSVVKLFSHLLSFPFHINEDKL